MKRIFKKVFKSKKLSLGSIQGLGASNFDIDKHWSQAIHSCQCLWLQVGWDYKRTSCRWHQCKCSASPFASLGIDLLISSRPPIILDFPPRFVTPSRMGLQAHKLPLASVYVFSFALYIFRYWLIDIEQISHNFGASTSVSDLEISDLPPVSVPVAGSRWRQFRQHLHLIITID